jgi:hypothetical protein
MNANEVTAKYEALCAQAIAETPEKYHKFISLISSNMKVGGTRDKPIFAAIRKPYMTVDGRVQIARDEHREAGKRLDISTELEHFGDHAVVKATISSDIYGTTSDYASINFGGGGVDKTNPIENACTSAVGRALGHMGYGLLGTGIASADEVDDAVSRREERPVPNMAAKKPESRAPESGASKQTVDSLLTLIKQKGGEGESVARQYLYERETKWGDMTAAHASELRALLGPLKTVGDVPTGKATDKQKAFILALIEEHALAPIADLIMEEWTAASIDALSSTQASDLIGRLQSEAKKAMA